MNIKELKKLKEVKLSDSEKQELFVRISKATKEASPLTNLSYPVPSPFQKLYSGKLKAMVFSFLILFMTSATAFASLDSLPGDLLYEVKTNVVEKVPDFLRRNPEQKARSNSEKIERRISEFEKLAEKGRLTEKNTRKIEKKIDKNLRDFDNNIVNIKQKNHKPEEENHLEKELKSKIKKHKEKIQKIREAGKTADKKALQSILDRVDSHSSFAESDREETEDLEENSGPNRQ